MIEPLLSLRISVDYAGRPGVLRDVSLEVQPGEILGLVGRSGEGKSTIALSVLGMLALKGGQCRGQISFRGRDLLQLNTREMRQVRGKEIGLVPQSPLSALNPNLRLGSQLVEAWRAHERGQPEWKWLLDSVSLPAEEAFLRQYPRNLSVGMAQRFLIAMAMLHSPALLLADEPTSALDMLTQAEILRLFRQLNQERRIAMLYISHDLASVASLCHRVAILHEAGIVECAPVDEVFRHPRHPYTQSLIAAIPHGWEREPRERPSEFVRLASGLTGAL
ncbi:MAG TPA: ABC transporter ATP-binding protein [Bryobacteraceae bacterium]|nr:ABC transporter ATP-binding protein [Bryobacteraceae bacterium]